MHMFHIFAFYLKMTVGRSKRRYFLRLTFIVKSVSRNLSKRDRPVLLACMSMSLRVKMVLEDQHYFSV